MKFNDLDKSMRIYETAHDQCVLPGIFIVVRLDGRGFTKLTREVHNFEAPFDSQFRDHMVATVAHLMECGFNVIYGYTQSDEISLLFHLGDETFGRKERKINSVLAGEASAKFSLSLGAMACFDSRVCQLPNAQKVVDYFRWRNEDAHRNALNSHCYWMLRKQGENAQAATNQLKGMSVADKNELLFQNGTNFNEVPTWQKRGIGLYWEEYEKEGFNPKSQQSVLTTKRRVKTDYELPMKEGYETFIENILIASQENN
ncbi:tRNA(His) guanylyltransferase Thg1 family protein [Kiloniella sp.]|uniref:tRNA(His) guanylyltransferase Thg1 family protein n=1 Tax=Kiloniella sp. TaxID=1938587 RepID=UPI003B016A00